MELDELRHIWQDLATQGSVELSESELVPILRQKTNDAISQLKRNLKIEMNICLWVCLPIFVLACIFMEMPIFMQGFFVASVIFTALFVIYYRRELHFLEVSQKMINLKESLSVTIQNLNRFLRFYLWFNYIVTPIFIFFGIYWRSSQYPDYLTVTLIMTLALSIISIFFIRWYVQRLYGRYLATLQKNLDELIEEN
jgi:membrane protein implicated in regulation of membrane protease activity